MEALKQEQKKLAVKQEQKKLAGRGSTLANAISKYVNAPDPAAGSQSASHARISAASPAAVETAASSSSALAATLADMPSMAPDATDMRSSKTVGMAAGWTESSEAPHGGGGGRGGLRGGGGGARGNDSEEEGEAGDEVARAWFETGQDPKIRSILEEAQLDIPKENPREKQRQLDRARRQKKNRPTAYEKTMRREIDDFNETMRERLHAIGVNEAADEQFQDTLEPGEAVVGALLKYHTHCQALGKYYAFTREDDDEDDGGGEAEKQKKLQSLINGLQDDPPSAQRNGSRQS